MDNVVVLNPGHLKSEFDRGYPASYAILNLTDQSCEIKIIDFFLNWFWIR